MNKKKVLFICSDDYPFYGANGRLLKNLFDAGLKDQYEIHVLTYIHRLTEKEEETIEGVTIHRFFSWFMFPKQQISVLLKEKCKAKIAIALMVKKVMPKICSIVNPHFFLSNQYCNDLFHMIMKLDQEIGFDVLVPVLAGYENVGAAIKYKKEKRNIKTIVYQMDPCSDNMMGKKGSQKKREKFEQSFVEEASHLIVTPIIKNRYDRIYGRITTNKVTALEFPAVLKREQCFKYEGEEIICLYAGNIYKGIRDPKYTFELFSMLSDSKVKLHIIGNCDEKEKASADLHSNTIVFHGSVPSAEVDKYLSKANILVNIGNRMDNQIPSKLFEYISTGKPIVNIYKNEECPSLPYLEKYFCSLSIREKTEMEIKDVEQLRAFILQNQFSCEKNETIRETYRDCTPEFVVKRVIDIIEKDSLRQ